MNFELTAGSVLRKQATPYFLTVNGLTLTVVQRMILGVVSAGRSVGCRAAGLGPPMTAMLCGDGQGPVREPPLRRPVPAS
jgi:hypothetical protein